MKGKHNKVNRRNFLKGMGAAGLGSVLTASGCRSTEEGSGEAGYPQVPRRTLGKTGVKIPCVALGATFNTVENQTILGSALEYGIDYWDTATNYADTKSELGIGKYLSKRPGLREKLFIVSKPPDLETPLPVVADMEEELQASLKRLNTSYVDLYCGVHGLSDPAQLTDELKAWVKEAKRRGVIRFFGFSTHKNMAQGLAAAAKLDWIDVILTLYNFQWVQNEEMQRAINACHKAGIGLVAIKTQRKATLEMLHLETEEDKKLTGHFLERGFTAGQAKLKIVLEDKRFTAAAIRMTDIAILTANVAAALDKTKLSQRDKAALQEYAKATGNRYCAGCAQICNSALPGMPYVSDIMRYLMYYNSYGLRDSARKYFARIPSQVRERLQSIDYSPAEARCPQHLPIAKAVSEAVSKLA